MVIPHFSVSLEPNIAISVVQKIIEFQIQLLEQQLEVLVYIRLNKFRKVVQYFWWDSR